MTVEIEDRGVTYKSWKTYAKALEREVGCLQQLLTTEYVDRCHRAATKGVVE